eukprot:6484459-Amphidinium_carterae.2
MCCREGTERAWLMKRRESVAKAIKTHRGEELMCLPATRVVGEKSWTEQHEKEVDFAVKKRVKRKVEAMVASEIPEVGCKCHQQKVQGVIALCQYDLNVIDNRNNFCDYKSALKISIGFGVRDVFLTH